MDFAPSATADDVCGRMWDFMRDHVFPAEPVYAQSGAWQLMGASAMTGDQSEISATPA
jgi:hypothetical protein